MSRLDRRALFTSGAAAALLAASGLSLAAAPRTGGQLRLAVTPGASFDAALRGTLFETLTEVAPDGLLRGELASGWQASDGAQTWTLDLDPAARFHDGAPVAAEDVVASLSAHGVAARLRAVSAHRLELSLETGDPDLPYLLADPSLTVAPGGAVGGLVGSGSYRLDAYRPGRHFTALRVEGHHRAGLAGWVDRVEVLVIPDAEVRAEALRDGYVDVAELPAPGGLRGRGDFVYHPSEGDMALAARSSVGLPRTVGARFPLDDGRIAQRWWIA